ncbi:ATP-binding protein [Mesorhizobium sp. M0060]|uniref:ATP-binding protein n=1 Tax=Mesorhizobium sp. M0060 TaxID=2956866 RepID=UPI0033393C0C
MHSLQSKQPPVTRRLERTTFTTSRLLDFCSYKELQAQTGHAAGEWPLVIVKELFDNALDACEEAGIAPEIMVRVDDTGISIADNGPGLPARTVKSILDFSSRTSSREAYVSPTRGAQGNALKTIVAMPFVLSEAERGIVEIQAQGKRHRITFAVDQIRQAPAIGYAVEPSSRKKGTELIVHWPDLAGSILDGAKARFLQIVDDYAWLNPHLTVTVDWYGSTSTTTATVPDWTKWKPSDPTSPHWYTPDRLARLIAAYAVHDAERKRDRTVREFVSEFRGLSATAKQGLVLEATALARTPLSGLITGNAVDSAACAALLGAMRGYSKPVKPPELGIIGRGHFEARFREAGCEMESFDYRKVADHDEEGIPYLVETAFGWLGDNAADERRMVTGVNWSPGIINPFRQLGSYGGSLDSILQQQRVGRDEPVIFVLHVACPRVEYLDRAKSAVVVAS